MGSNSHTVFSSGHIFAIQIEKNNQKRLFELVHTVESREKLPKLEAIDGEHKDVSWVSTKD